LRSAAWRVNPFFFAVPSSFFHMMGGNRTERGSVSPTSASFLGRPRPTWTSMPSRAMRAAYGFERVFAVAKSTSGISRNDAFVGSVALRFLFARFVEPPLRAGRLARADDSRFIFIELQINRNENATSGRFTDEQRPLDMAGVFDDASERKTVAASENETPCFRALEAAFRASQVNRTMLVYYIIAPRVCILLLASLARFMLAGSPLRPFRACGMSPCALVILTAIGMTLVGIAREEP
jgi:hypothetical protein